jgi:hypothetical protein
MTPTASRAAVPQVGPTLARNLPVALLFCAGYFVFFASVWGPLRPWKLAVALCIALGLALGLRLRDPRRDARAARRRKEPGGRADIDRAAWPWWRRAGLLVSGTLLCAAAVYQSLGTEVDLAAYPLVSGLCLILGCAVGATLIGYGWPRERWQRPRILRRSGKRVIRPRAARTAPPPEPPSAESATSTFRIPVPKDAGFSGAWGGFGSRPARPVWTPGSKGASAAESGPVPKRFRGLRLLRSERSREAPMATSALIILSVFGAGFIAALLYWILGG